jgi:hypothetical protein
MGDSRYGIAARNAAVDGMAALLNSGYIRFYTGARPADPSVAISSQTLLAELRFGATAFAAAAAGSAAANAITPDSGADNTGTAVWARLLKSDGTTAVLDVDIGVGGGGAPPCIILASVAIQIGALVSLSSCSLSAPQQGT